MRRLFTLTVALFALLPTVTRAADPAPFEIREGDRILFLGDTLLEREGTYGYLETRLHEQFPERRFIVRNLSWSGEMPRGWSRASFDDPAKGYERLQEDVAKVRPTVVFLGFGMAATLQELTDRSGDITLNPDPRRYGEEPMSAARFKKELGELMDAIVAQAAAAAAPGSTPVPGVGPGVSPGRTSTGEANSAAAAASQGTSPEVRAGGTPAPTRETRVLPSGVRFVLLSPIRHEDLRAARPGLPDPAPHNALLDAYTRALGELARERGATFIDIFHAWEKRPRPNLSAADARTLAEAMSDLSPNGIHLSELGYSAFAEDVGTMLGWKRQLPEERAAFEAWKERHKAFARAVLPAVVKKNELFFHQFRPANSTYLFGFRKHEQGQNAKEMPMFDPLIEAAEAEIDRLKKNAPAAAAAVPGSTPVPGVGPGVSPGRTSADATSATTATASNSTSPEVRRGETPLPTPGTGVLPGATATPPPLPDFTVEDGYQIELWAQNPLMEKPTQMNWDAQGRLWVCSSSLYPQIAPGQAANDKIIVLEDTDRDGKADKSTVFADGLLIPTGVVPDLVKSEVGSGKSEGKSAAAGSLPTSDLRLPTLSPSACYVGQSTELLYLRDLNGDGRADEKRIVFGGFGTEDTHHIVHTLHWGPDGRLFFHQSVYIHTHLETPWGMVRLNSGGVFAYDPRTERVEVFIKGLWNTWGQAEDDWGQSFFTDGAGSTGITWGFPGAIFAPFEGSRRQMASISPGSYPKFCGLESVKSPHFPADWQGNLITCDFRAHRVVRFQLQDLSHPQIAQISAEGSTPAASSSSENLRSSAKSADQPSLKSGFTTVEMPDLIRTTDLSFRPIDVKMGPDGALYIADWSNPVINHGEVDFRDPRRDKHMGRIWRVTKKGAPLVKWEPLIGKKNEELLDKLLSTNAWEQRQARRILFTSDQASVSKDAMAWLTTDWLTTGRATFTGPKNIAALQFGNGLLEAQKLSLEVTIPHARALAARFLGEQGIVIRETKSKLGFAKASTDEEARLLAAARAQYAAALDGSDLEKLARDPNPRVRLESMRALARIQTAESASLVLDAATYKEQGGARASSPQQPASSRRDGATASPTADPAIPASQRPAGMPAAAGKMPALPAQNATGANSVAMDDPHYDFAAWLSINDLAKPWTDAVISGAWKTEGREAQLAYGLKAIDPALAGVTLSKLFAAGKVPLDGSGPWIELIGTAGGPGELQRLLDGLLAGWVGDCCGNDETTAIDSRLALVGPAAEQAIAALQNAARLRNAKPAAHAHLVTTLFKTRGEIGLGAIRLAGLWKVPDAVEKIGELVDSRETKPEQRRAAVEGLRGAGTPAALNFLRILTRSEEETATRAAALVAIAQVKLDAGVVAAAEVLPTLSDEAALLAAWRGLMSVKGAPEAFAVKLGKQEVAKSLPAPVLKAAVQAAREAGRPGAKLVAALAPFTGGTIAPAAPADYATLAQQTKQNGDPAKGEFVYRRATSACVTCHAIGGAGGKVGPDMTSIGASAPLDYLIESILNPNAKVKEGYNAVSLSLADGTVATGIQARETASEIILRDAVGQETGVPKAAVKSKTDIGSMMPAGLTATMTPREAIDLYAFLSQLGKPGPYDASKGKVARVWRLYPGDAVAGVLDPGYNPATNPGFPGYTLVDGRFVKELLTEATTIAAGGADTVLLATQFQANGQAKLTLTGAEKAWLDGQPIALGAGGTFTPELGNSTHTLVVKIGVKELPPVLRVSSEDVRFLGN